MNISVERDSYWVPDDMRRVCEWCEEERGEHKPDCLYVEALRALAGLRFIGLRGWA